MDGCVATVVPFRENETPRAALVTGPAPRVLVNGYPALPISILEDRDELSIAGELLYFSAATSTETFRFAPQGRSETRCARCKESLRSDDIVARCGRCGALHHEGLLADRAHEGRDCWSHDARCAGCLVLREELEWHPEDGDD